MLKLNNYAIGNSIVKQHHFNMFKKHDLVNALAQKQPLIKCVCLSSFLSGNGLFPEMQQYRIVCIYQASSPVVVYVLRCNSI